MKRSRVPTRRVRSRVSCSQPRSFGVNLLKDWLTDPITTTYVSDLGNGDAKRGMKLFLREKCEEDAVQWTSNPAFYVTRALRILEERELARSTSEDLCVLPERPCPMDDCVPGAESEERNESFDGREEHSTSEVHIESSLIESDELVSHEDPGNPRTASQTAPGPMRSICEDESTGNYIRSSEDPEDPPGPSDPREDGTQAPHRPFETTSTTSDHSPRSFSQDISECFPSSHPRTRAFEAEHLSPGRRRCRLPLRKDDSLGPLFDPMRSVCESERLPMHAEDENLRTMTEEPREDGNPRIQFTGASPPPRTSPATSSSPTRRTTLNTSLLLEIVRQAEDEDVMTEGIVSVEKVRSFLKFSCAARRVRWTTNPSFYINKAMKMLEERSRDDCPQPEEMEDDLLLEEEDATNISMMTNTPQYGRRSNLAQCVRESIARLAPPRILALRKGPMSHLQTFVRETGRSLCTASSIPRPKTWTYYYKVATEALDSSRILMFKRNKSRHNARWKEKIQRWRHISCKQRDSCAHQVKMEFVRECPGRCPTFNAVRRAWRNRLHKLRRRDRRIYGHCMSVWTKLKLLKWKNEGDHPAQIPATMPRSSMCIRSLNVGGGYHNILSTLAQCDKDTDIFCFQETWHLPSESLANEVPHGWKVFTKAREGCVEGTRGGGLAIFIKKHFLAKPTQFRQDDLPDADEGEFMCLKVGSKNRTFFVWNLYIPHSARDTAPLLSRRIIESSKRSPIIVIGDFNWNWMDNPRSPRGNVWMNIAAHVPLRMVNDNLGPTFSRFACESLIDHAWIDTRLSVTHVRVTESGYEHKTTSFYVDNPIAPDSQGMIQKTRVRWEKVRDHSAFVLKDQLNRCILKDLKKRNTVDAANFIASVRNSSTKVLGFTRTQTQSRFDQLPYWNAALADTVRSMRTNRRRILSVARSSMHPVLKWGSTNYLRKKQRDYGRELRRNMWESKNKYFRKVKSSWWKSRTIPKYAWTWFTGKKLSSDSASIPFSPHEMNEAWREVISVAPSVSEHEWMTIVDDYLKPDHAEDNQPGSDDPRHDIFPSDFTPALLEKCASNLNLGKAPGLDGIPNEGFKYLNSEVLQFLFDLFKGILSGEHVPNEWKRSEVCLIPKKSNGPMNPLSFRPISLLPCIAKLLESVVRKMVEKYIIEHNLDIIHCLQGGFQEGRSSIDQSWILRTVLENQEFLGTNTFVAFLDITKAYDTVPLQALLCSFIDGGLPSWFIAFARDWVTGHKRILRVGNNKVHLDVLRGVPQGSVLAPLMFNIFIDSLLRRLENMGCRMNAKWVGALLYADDIALISSDASEIQRMIDVCVSWSKEFGMQFSCDKSKWMYIPHRRNRSANSTTDAILLLDGVPFEHVDHFCYLGIEVTTTKTRWAKVDTMDKKNKVIEWVESRRKLIHPGYGLPIWIGRLIAQSVFWPRMWFGIELGTPFHRESAEGRTFQHTTARAVLGTFGCTRSEAMLAFLGWPDFQTLCHVRLLSHFIRLCSHSHTAVTEVLWSLLSNEDLRNRSCWWRSVLRACGDLGIETPESFEDTEAALERLICSISYWMQESVGSFATPHPSVKECGHNATYVFIFSRGYFNPRVRGIFPSVQCPFCELPGGDSPQHLLICDNPVVETVVSSCCTKVQLPQSDVIDLCLGKTEWNELPRMKMRLIGRLLRDLYRIRWKKKRILRAGAGVS